VRFFDFVGVIEASRNLDFSRIMELSRDKNVPRKKGVRESDVAGLVSDVIVKQCIERGRFR